MAKDFQVTMRMKDFFFDRRAVTDRMSKANKKALSKAGAFIRRRARSSLRRRKKPSKAGSPPSVHTRDRVATLKNILFAYEPKDQTLVVGPVALNQRTFLGPQLEDSTAPQVQEFGATVKIREVKVGKHWRTGVRRPSGPTRIRTANYAPRPFMGPALEKEAEEGTIPEAWAGTVKG